MTELPIDSLRAGLCSAIDGGARRIVVSAPTGSGKSTRLPAMICDKVGGRVLVLQPRRVAARMLAKGVASIFGMGDSVGWHVRFDKHYSKDAKIVFLTEGILARMLLSDPCLEGVSAIVFDEFHERNIYADISLALALRCQETSRPDLLLAVCSASMDSGAIASYLGNAVEFECRSRQFPVDVEYSPPKDRNARVWDLAAREFERLSKEEKDGNFLIFMPGAYEIGKTVSKILESPASKGFDVLPLHGDLPPAQQDSVLSAGSRRKVIVSTNVAETSLTIEGVRFVIDSGFARVARFDSARGVNTLLCERISLASATQRAGRAGRTAPGRAVRLWRKSDEPNFDKYTPSEISRIDLSQIVLWLSAAGLSMDSLKLFENPPPEALQRARLSLKRLGAVDSGGRITKLGRDMASFPVQPRCARLLIEGARRNCLEKISLIAALDDVGRIKFPLDDAFAENGRDALVGDAKSEPEEIARLCEIARQNSFSESFCRRAGIHCGNARKAVSVASDLERLARRFSSPGRDTGAGGEISKCVLCAYSDMVGVRLNRGTLACRFSGGRRGEIRKESRAYASDIFAALEMREQNVAGGVSVLASMIVPVEREMLAELFPEDFSNSVETKFDSVHRRVVSATSVRFGDLVIEESASGSVDLDEAAKILHGEIMAGRLQLKNMDDAARDFIERVNFVASACPESGILPIDDSAISDILLQMCFGMTSYAEVKNSDVHSALRGWLSSGQLSLLNSLAPRFAEFPHCKKPCTIRYDASALRATISSYFRNFYDFDPKKIKICGGKIKPTFELLAPSGRPVQTTQNLDEFWCTSWPSVKKELKARYPKHFKPGDSR